MRNKMRPIRAKRGGATLAALWLGCASGFIAPNTPIVNRFVHQDQKPAAFAETLPDSVVKIPMVPVPGGTITQGGKQVQVKAFYLAAIETPWEAVDLFLRSGPPSPAYDQTDFAPDAIARPSRSYILPDLGWGHHGYPAINLSHTTVEMFCRWMAAATKKKYRLPTEAEWELACRSGANGDWKIEPDALEKSAWHVNNCGRRTHPVGTKAPNSLGIHDMLGNVGEWAIDSEGKPVLCGGTFRDGPEAQNPFSRQRWAPKWQESDPQIPKSRWWLSNGPFVGFRVACEM